MESIYRVFYIYRALVKGILYVPAKNAVIKKLINCMLPPRFPRFRGFPLLSRFTYSYRCWIMYRETLPIHQLGAWVRLNDVKFNGVTTTVLQGNRGSGLVTTARRPKDSPLLMTIPHDLVLSLENVWVYAKSDKHLRQVLEATGDYSRVSGPKAAMKHSEAPNVH